ncbi:MAG: hypothetical protein IKE38_04465 [Erysipelotrichaceae bacterium]|nr:hypothetical protein [Erysipelotrichaceae bacterium]
MEQKIEYRIAEYVKEAGGRAFYVGGYVRDELLGVENKDIDIEVHGVDTDVLMDILKKTGEPLMYGNSFGIYSLKGHHIDIAVPRKERPTGKGHRDFTVDIDPYIGYKEAARRRDLTINSLMRDILTGEIIDPYGGLHDLEEGVIRYVNDDTFAEDPLRVLRVAQFASRFEFRVADETKELCRKIDLGHLSKERVEEELKKALLKGKRPSIFFEVLKETGQLDRWFTELKQLIGLKQDPLYHPEGDVWTHTMQVIDRAAEYRSLTDTYPFMLLCLVHDLGKIITTKEINGRIHSYGHETKGLPLVRNLIRRISNRKDIMRYTQNMVSLHMRPNMLVHDKASPKAFNRMFYEALAPLDLVYFAVCDSGTKKHLSLLLKKYEEFREVMERPYVNGDDLIENGLEPDSDFSPVLEYATKLRLAGIEKQDALKQTLAYAEKRRKNAKG